MANKKKVLITGASGYVASLMRDEFRDRYELVLVDVTDDSPAGGTVADIKIADLMNADRSGYDRLFEGVDSVIHLGYKGSSAGGVFGDAVPHIERFEVEHSNVLMANNVYRAAYDAGVRRMVVASSNHAADWYEHALVHPGKLDVVSPEDLPVSDNFYGWAKAAYELLAWPYACGKFGRQLEFVHVRIGFPCDVDGAALMADKPGTEPAGGGVANFKRYLGAHFSARDVRQLFSKAIELEDIRDEHGIPYLVVYGISGNTRRFWSLDTARNRLGYEPEDDSEVKFAGDVQRFLTGPSAEAPVGRVGG